MAQTASPTLAGVWDKGWTTNPEVWLWLLGNKGAVARDGRTARWKDVIQGSLVEQSDSTDIRWLGGLKQLGPAKTASMGCPVAGPRVDYWWLCYVLLPCIKITAFWF